MKIDLIDLTSSGKESGIEETGEYRHLYSEAAK